MANRASSRTRHRLPILPFEGVIPNAKRRNLAWGGSRLKCMSASRHNPRHELSGIGHLAYTIPFLNSSKGYFVPRQTIPPCHKVKNMERSKV